MATAHDTEDRFAASRQRFEGLLSFLGSGPAGVLTHAELESALQTEGREAGVVGGAEDLGPLAVTGASLSVPMAVEVSGFCRANSPRSRSTTPRRGGPRARGPAPP